MADVSPFAGFHPAASPNGGASPESGGSAGSPPRRVVGFQRSASSSVEGLPRACSTAERQASLGELNRALHDPLRTQGNLAGPRPRLTIQTSRSCRLGTRVKPVPRIQEDTELAAGGGGSNGGSGTPGTTDLGATAPSRAPVLGMTRACSGNIDMPARWVLLGRELCGGLPASAALGQRGGEGPAHEPALEQPMPHMNTTRTRLGNQCRLAWLVIKSVKAALPGPQNWMPSQGWAAQH